MENELISRKEAIDALAEYSDYIKRECAYWTKNERLCAGLVIANCIEIINHNIPTRKGVTE